MKNYLVLLLSVTLIICAILLSKYYSIKENHNKIIKFNLKYEQYTNKPIAGRDVATIINQAVDDNEYFMVKKDENQRYIQDDENSINIEIEITEFKDVQTYTMETLYNGGMSEFVKYYGQILFECKKIEYNSKGQVKYMLFEQINSNN